MNRWKTLWKSRKQSDRVKIMLCLGIAAAVFIVLAVVDTVGLVRHINTPTEYVLLCGNVTDTVLDQLADIDGIGAVTPAKSTSLTVKYRTVGVPVQVTCVSAEYAKNVYGAERRGEMTTVFANSKAYERILAELGGAAGSPELHSELKAEFLDGDSYRACRIVRVLQTINTEEAFAVTIMADSALKAQCDSVRVFVPKQDTEQTAVGRIQDMGHSVMNREDILSFHSEIDRLFLEMKYNLIIAVMCGLWIMSLRSFAPDRQRL